MDTKYIKTLKDTEPKTKDQKKNLKLKPWKKLDPQKYKSRNKNLKHEIYLKISFFKRKK